MLVQHILRIKLFLRKSSIILNSNSEKRNSIFMKGNAYFLNAHFKEHSKMVRSVLQAASKNFNIKYSV
jgi:hypothetical protein